MSVLCFFCAYIRCDHTELAPKSTPVTTATKWKLVNSLSLNIDDDHSNFKSRHQCESVHVWLMVLELWCNWNCQPKDLPVCYLFYNLSSANTNPYTDTCACKQISKWSSSQFVSTANVSTSSVFRRLRCYSSKRFAVCLSPFSCAREYAIVIRVNFVPFTFLCCAKLLVFEISCAYMEFGQSSHTHEWSFIFTNKKRWKWVFSAHTPRAYNDNWIIGTAKWWKRRNKWIHCRS